MRYSIEAGRLICEDGKPFVTIQRGASAIEYISPNEIDAFARRAVACMNACDGIPGELLKTGTIIERLAARMVEIDGDVELLRDDIATCHDYSELWDAILDEIGPALSTAIIDRKNARQRAPAGDDIEGTG